MSAEFKEKWRMSPPTCNRDVPAQYTMVSTILARLSLRELSRSRICMCVKTKSSLFSMIRKVKDVLSKHNFFQWHEDH